jgi:hypothetical protein
MPVFGYSEPLVALSETLVRHITRAAPTQVSYFFHYSTATELDPLPSVGFIYLRKTTLERTSIRLALFLETIPQHSPLRTLYDYGSFKWR